MCRHFSGGGRGGLSPPPLWPHARARAHAHSLPPDVPSTFWKPEEAEEEEELATDSETRR